VWFPLCRLVDQLGFLVDVRRSRWDPSVQHALPTYPIRGLRRF
jgi:hypothetical protein